jgi:hypothetical protein
MLRLMPPNSPGGGFLKAGANNPPPAFNPAPRANVLRNFSLTYL